MTFLYTEEKKKKSIFITLSASQILLLSKGLVCNVN